ncbi:DUF6285 domain-containing protein [Azospirillum rugosum]|uniref:DUF6285 domain-containing protein n=1 Tax=Azospirillum rugosum TaxID=416170 RepID=A0ABS4SLH5_9PROT|nr:DUF6285 domain-containing protein [Azospirillum rugosum]MBP2293413.1 hypothetical protein [Azospirillum rugosum]MDQ0530184.1 hypothetical protein [Azospirillum rugosum]
MRTSPDARELLAISLKTFREELLPHIPPAQRYTALMIANALGIVEREMAGLDEAGHTMLGALALLYGEDADDSLSGDDLRERVHGLQHRLCIEIAAGDFDHGGQDTVGQDTLMECLEEIVHARLGISNPKALNP